MSRFDVQAGTCPHCRGTGKTTAISCGVRPNGQRFSNYGAVRCSTCDGAGTVYEARAQAIREGEALRQARLEAMLSLREAAEQRGVDVVTYSKTEHGQSVPNTPEAPTA